ncbi:MAG: serine/threonine-protein kinase HipA [Parvicellaceae bacterium]|jgi:serine/threonine-protein kinase HipA
MIQVVEIRLWGDRVGALSWNAQQNLGSFQYDPNFIKKGIDLSPLHMPISKDIIYTFPSLNDKTFKGLPGMLSDILPDDFGNTLINRWLELNQIPKSKFTPLDRLCYIGTRGMGALEFHPVRHEKSKAVSEVEIDKLVALTSKILSSRESLKLNAKEAEELTELIKVGTSAGGQRAKAIIGYSPATEQICSGQTEIAEGFQHYLIKFDGVTDHSLNDPQGYGKIEYAYYLMAIDSGIEMMSSRMLHENGRSHFMTQRFDRLGNEKVHMQTLCSIAHFDYHAAGDYSYEDAFSIMRRLKLPANQFRKLFKRMVFNVASRNQDDHTKNISFLMDRQGKWSLSPAYDVTYSYNPDGIWTNMHQMSINGKRDDISFYDLVEVAKRQGISKPEQIINQVNLSISKWEEFATIAGVEKGQIVKIKKAFRLLNESSDIE